MRHVMRHRTQQRSGRELEWWRGFWIPAFAGMTGWGLRWAAVGRASALVRAPALQPSYRQGNGEEAPAVQPVVPAQAGTQCGV